MPKVKRSRKPPPDGWELIEPTLDELDQKMREGRPIKDGFYGCAAQYVATSCGCEISRSAYPHLTGMENFK